MYIAQLSSRTSNVLNALVSSEQIRFKQTSAMSTITGVVQEEVKFMLHAKSRRVSALTDVRPWPRDILALAVTMKLKSLVLVKKAGAFRLA